MAVSAIKQHEDQTKDHTTAGVMADCIFAGLGALSSVFEPAATAYDYADPASALHTERHQNAAPAPEKSISADNDNMTYTRRAAMMFAPKPRWAA